MPESDNPRPSRPPWTDQQSQLLLLAAGTLAWIIAVALAATETSLSVAVVFVPAGWALIGAAAFYRRLRKFGPRGVEVDPAEAIQTYSQAIPPAAADASAPGERARLLDGLSAYLEDMADPEDIRNAAEFAAARYTAGVALEAGAERWLRREGFEVEVLSGPLDKGVDLIGRREDVIYAVIVKSSRRGAPADPLPSSCARASCGLAKPPSRAVRRGPSSDSSSPTWCRRHISRTAIAATASESSTSTPTAARPI